MSMHVWRELVHTCGVALERWRSSSHLVPRAGRMCRYVRGGITRLGVDDAR